MQLRDSACLKQTVGLGPSFKDCTLQCQSSSLPLLKTLDYCSI